jgi:monoamine oxidase
MSSEPKKVDVLILGAGLSGLSAAFRLQERCPEMTFLIAEANDRFGGRTLSVDVKNPCNKDQTDTLDMGAHWVCERQKDIMQLIQKLGIEYYPQNITGKEYEYLKGGLISESIVTLVPLPPKGVKSLS